MTTISKSPNDSKCKCTKYDSNWNSKLRIPKVFQFCGINSSSPQSTIFSSKLLYFRIFSLIYCIVILIWNLSRFIRHDITQYWLIFLTQWIAVVITLYFITISILNFKLLRYINISNKLNAISSNNSNNSTENNSRSDSSQQSNMNCPYNNDDIGNIDIIFEHSSFKYLSSMSLILFAMSFPPSIVITFANWTLITNYSTYIEPGNTDDIEKCLNDVHMHGILLILLLIEYMYNLSYFKYSHVLYSFLFGITFMIWSIIHYFAKLSSPWHKHYIYPILNWKYPQTAIPVALFMVIANVLLHILFSWIKYKYILNKWVNKKINNLTKSNLEAQIANGTGTGRVSINMAVPSNSESGTFPANKGEFQGKSMIKCVLS